MISYLINFTLCSALMLLVYHLLLKNKVLYHFNRAYLLLSIVFSLTVPLVVVSRAVTPIPNIQPVQEELFTQPNIVHTQINNEPVIIDRPVNYYAYALGLYSIITGLLLFRFAKDLYTLSSTIKNNEVIPYKNVNLVLINKQLTPHTFLHYIFLNKQDHERQSIELDILKHELTHAQQYHTADIIFIELISAICWFNPFFILYKKATRLNHEFIADAAVLNTHHNICSYQQLLLSKLTQTPTLNITSQFNYHITKNRLIMMNKTTSRAASWFSRLAIIPVFTIAFMLFCSRSDAGQQLGIKPITPGHFNTPINKTDQPVADTLTEGFERYVCTKNGLPDNLMQEYRAFIDKYKPFKPHPDRRLGITPADRKRMVQLFEQMSRPQQKEQSIGFRYSDVPPLPPGQPSTTQIDAWAANASEYGVWIDDKRIKNADLKNYRPADFSEFDVSRLTPPAVKHDGFHYQIGLMTPGYYKNYVKDALTDKDKLRLYFHMKPEYK